MLTPMLASLADPPLQDPRLVYEPKYDGIRAIAEVPAGGRGVRLWSRLGNEKTRQFPEVTAALEAWARRRKAPVVLDGEIVALDARGQPTGFQQLQGRIHLTSDPPDRTVRRKRAAGDTPKPAPEPGGRGRIAYIVFDVLRDGARDLRDWPLTERRAALERLIGARVSDTLRLSEVVAGDGRELYKRALDSGWEGLIAKGADSKYHSGKRTPDWRKLKIVKEQEFVVGGWTEPRNTRSAFGALLLGVYDPHNPDTLIYVGHTGTGFNERELTRVMRLLKPLETRVCPFSPQPRTNERPHWVEPKLVAQIKFTEWTADGKLRHPVYLGLRDDKDPRDVIREPQSRLHTVAVKPLPEKPAPGLARAAAQRAKPEAASSDAPRPKPEATSRLDTSTVLGQLRELQSGPGQGVLDLPGGDRLEVTNLRKVFWPKQKLTKGDLFRYYLEVAPFILPAVADRPLVMKRFPNGIAAKPFYQHRVENQTIPPGVRVERVAVEEQRPQLVGGNLITLLYMTQLASISQDPWFSRVQRPQFADYVALDLDPSDGVSFKQVLDVARWIHDELDRLGGMGVPKTSGSRGLHIYLPLPPNTPYEAGLLLCQIIATVVATHHPKQATIERSVRARGRRVYVDYLQNILGKTLATAYSARASEYAGVSTPLTWDEVDAGVEREAFTLTSVPARLKKVGDLWEGLRKSKGIDLARVARYADTIKGSRSRA